MQILKVVINFAEIAVKLIEDINYIITKNKEKNNKFLIMVDYRKNYPDSRKNTLIEQKKNYIKY
jgi:hypothetical protein